MREPEPVQSREPARGAAAAGRDERSRALLAECFGQFIDRLRDAMHTAVHATNDLFDASPQVSAHEVDVFRAHRDEWLVLWERTQRSLYSRRLAGTRRSGRRPDAQATLGTIQLLDPFDQQMQVALIVAVKGMHGATGPELFAFSRRVARLLGEKWHAFDNPFDAQYLLDAIGVTARSLYSRPHVWRALMERIVTELTPVLPKLYGTLNRYLADQNVMPDLKAQLRVRSPHLPTDERDLLEVFGRLLQGARAPGAPLPPVVVPQLHIVGQPPRPPAGATVTPMRPVRSAAPHAPAGALQSPPVRLPEDALRSALAELARAGAADALIPPPGSPRPGRDGELPAVDPLMALGTSRTLVATLGRLQRLDLPQAIIRAAPPVAGRRLDAALVPSNLLPFLRVALADQIAHENNAMVIDFVALLFDYVFRDPTIPAALHGIFERLQVPIVKTALLDADFFANRDHPARGLLDVLAEAAIGADGDPAYLRDLERLAIDVVIRVCDQFRLDTSIFADAAAEVRGFVDDDRLRTASAVSADIAAALAAEQRELGRTQARAVVRDRLAGLDVPLRVRSFAETVWVEYLVLLGEAATGSKGAHDAAVKTLEALLWSIAAKERQFQRTRLARMIPPLVVELRRGALATNVPPERLAQFLDDLFSLHTAALAPAQAPLAPPVATRAHPEGPARAEAAAPASTLHDFVSEMIVGSWIAFRRDATATPSRLWWVSPMRTRYVFKKRERVPAWTLTPEELAHDLETGRAWVLAEPVPMLERAISAAFDTLGGVAPRVAA